MHTKQEKNYTTQYQLKKYRLFTKSYLQTTEINVNKVKPVYKKAQNNEIKKFSNFALNLGTFFPIKMKI